MKSGPDRKYTLRSLCSLQKALSAIISPMMLANTSSQNASVVGFYAGVHCIYALGVLVIYHPVLMDLILA